MELVTILTGQLITMFLYLAVGWCLRKTELITTENSKALSNLLLYVLLPCVIVRSFMQEANPEKTAALGMSIFLGALSLAIAMAVSAACFRKHPVSNFGAAFSNAGFMGIPLISAVLGSEATFYIAGMVALLNILQWTYGQAVLQGSWAKCRPAEILKNPLVIAFLCGLLLYFLPISLPGQLQNAMDALADCNAPVAMVILGVLLGNVSLKQLFGTARAWMASGVRLLLIPAITVLILGLFRTIPESIRTAILIASAAPIGSNLAVYVQKQGGNSEEAASMVCLSTILSAITMPLALLLAANLW